MGDARRLARDLNKKIGAAESIVARLAAITRVASGDNASTVTRTSRTTREPSMNKAVSAAKRTIEAA